MRRDANELVRRWASYVLDEQLVGRQSWEPPPSVDVEFGVLDASLGSRDSR